MRSPPFRSDLSRVAPYRAVTPLETLAGRYGVLVDDWVKLNQNENPYGPHPDVLEAVRHVQFHRYPDNSVTALVDAIAQYVDLEPGRVVVGAGGDEIIDVIFRLFLDPGDEIISFPPTFGFYSVAAGLSRASVVHVPRDDAFRVDVESAREALTKRTKLIVLCSPNNPTGNQTQLADVERLLALGPHILVDEAYVEFADCSARALLEGHPRLMIVRTFSKWAGLAGLRLGYGLFSKEVADAMRRVKPAYTVSSVAQAAGLAALRHSKGDAVARVRRTAHTLHLSLQSNSLLSPSPTDANFVYCRMREGIDLDRVYQALLRKGVLVRRFDQPPALRISVGTDAEVERLLSALRTVEIELTESRLEPAAQ